MIPRGGWVVLPLLTMACGGSAPPPVVAVPQEPAQPAPTATPPPPPPAAAAMPPAAAAMPPAALDPTSVEFLAKVAEAASTGLPKMLDKETREELVTAEPGALVYHNRLVNKRASQLDVATFERILKPSIVQNDCSNGKVRDQFLDRGVKLRYTYVDKDGTFITTVDIVLADCP